MSTLHLAPGSEPRVTELTTRPDDLEANAVDEVAALGAEADRRSHEMDAIRGVPDDLYRRAALAGLFRQLVPRELGGLGGTPIEWFRRGVELARHEASFAWVVTQGAAELGWIAAGGDEGWARDVLADPLAASASSTAGLGTLTITPAGARFGGRWAFNTGCAAATWIGGIAALDDPGGTDGRPSFRWAWVPASRARIVEDWDPSGLRGTGSHTTVVEEQKIPVAWTFDPTEQTSNDRGPYRCVVGNGNWPIATAVAATQIGNARRALDEVRSVVLAKRRVPDLLRLADHAAVQREVVLLEGLWHATVTAVASELESMWEEANRHGELSARQRVALHTVNVAADQLGVQIVDRACTLSGTAALPRRSALARCRRDAHALHQHIATGNASIEANASMTLIGSPPHFLV